VRTGKKRFTSLPVLPPPEATMIANDGIIIFQLLSHSILLVWLSIGMGQIVRFLNKTGWKEGEMDTKDSSQPELTTNGMRMDTKDTDTFDEWWAGQIAKIKRGERPFLASSIYPGDQKVAFQAGYDSRQEEVDLGIMRQEIDRKARDEQFKAREAAEAECNKYREGLKRIAALPYLPEHERRVGDYGDIACDLLKEGEK
jgi:hypothetical protein